MLHRRTYQELKLEYLLQKTRTLNITFRIASQYWLQKKYLQFIQEFIHSYYIWFLMDFCNFVYYRILISFRIFTWQLIFAVRSNEISIFCYFCSFILYSRTSTHLFHSTYLHLNHPLSNLYRLRSFLRWAFLLFWTFRYFGQEFSVSVT